MMDLTTFMTGPKALEEVVMTSDDGATSELDNSLHLNGSSIGSRPSHNGDGEGPAGSEAHGGAHSDSEMETAVGVNGVRGSRSSSLMETNGGLNGGGVRRSPSTACGDDLPLSSSESSDGGEEVEDADGDEEHPPYTGCFEGPEKTLEVLFKPSVGSSRGCRELTRKQLDKVLKQAKCTIISSISNDHLDAYVLSESSLFVYTHKLLIKTCGTTTLLRCISTLLRFAAADLGMELEWLGYSRKNLTFPGDQLFPHSSFEQELGYLRAHSHLSQRLNGAGYVLGPVTGDHWFVYVADKCDRPDYAITDTDRTLNLMMFDMGEEVSEVFYKKNCPTGRDMSEKSGIINLVPGAKMDDCAFEPCGYSMNAIQYDSYYTVHVTPEESCSYASFETNNPFKSYRGIINNVLNVFKPRRFVMTMLADEAGLKTIGENPFESTTLQRGSSVYRRTSMNYTKVEGDCCLMMSTYSLESGLSSGGEKRALARQRSMTIV